MSSANDRHNRAYQQDARAWADFTDTKYTAALRQIQSPFVQGILGERVSARHLISTVENRPFTDRISGETLLGENGYQSETPFHFNWETTYVDLVLLIEFLRMFTLLPSDITPDVGSYSLKHTAERFFDTYVSNGKLIWAAAAAGIPMSKPRRGDLNVMIGIPETEHEYVKRSLDPGLESPKAHHHRPPGYEYLRTALIRLTSGESLEERWVRPKAVQVNSPFHDWLVQQVHREDLIGRVASDYEYGTRTSQDEPVRSPEELCEMAALDGMADWAYEGMVSIIHEWNRISERTIEGVRTRLIDSSSEDVDGFGAGAGTTERHEYVCLCGDGSIVEEHDNIPGFRDHHVYIACNRCTEYWQFVDGRPVRQWELELKDLNSSN